MKTLEALNEIGTISEILVDLSKSHITCEEAINEIRECNVGTNYGIIKQDLEELQALHDYTGVYDRTFLEYFKMYHEISQKHFLELVGRRKKMEKIKALIDEYHLIDEMTDKEFRETIIKIVERGER